MNDNDNGYIDECTGSDRGIDQRLGCLLATVSLLLAILIVSYLVVGIEWRSR